MAGLNKVMLIGNLGKDPEIRYTQSGQAVVNFSIATSRQWKDKDGEFRKETEWHKIIAWGKLAEICDQYLVKGKQVYIEGRIQTRKWEDRDGVTRYTTEIVADQMLMLGSKGDTYSEDKRTTEPARKTENKDTDTTDTEDDLPF